MGRLFLPGNIFLWEKDITENEKKQVISIIDRERHFGGAFSIFRHLVYIDQRFRLHRRFGILGEPSFCPRRILCTANEYARAKVKRKRSLISQLCPDRESNPLSEYSLQAMLFPCVISLFRYSIFLAPVFYRHTAGSTGFDSFLPHRYLDFSFSLPRVHMSLLFQRILWKSEDFL